MMSKQCSDNRCATQRQEIFSCTRKCLISQWSSDSSSSLESTLFPQGLKRYEIKNPLHRYQIELSNRPPSVAPHISIEFLFLFFFSDFFEFLLNDFLVKLRNNLSSNHHCVINYTRYISSIHFRNAFREKNDR